MNGYQQSSHRHPDCSETLKDDVSAGLPAQLELVDEIHAAGKRATELTRQLLAFARKQEIARSLST